MRFTKSISTALALTIGAVTFASTAEAERRHYYRHHHNNHGGALAAGALGLAAGAIIGGALARPRYYEPYYAPAPVYVQPAPVYVQPAPVYAYGREAWSPAWYAYCEDRYRSFNPQTGYFLGYDGEYHFCN